MRRCHIIWGTVPPSAFPSANTPINHKISAPPTIAYQYRSRLLLLLSSSPLSSYSGPLVPGPLVLWSSLPRLGPNVSTRPPCAWAWVLQLATVVDASAAPTFLSPPLTPDPSLLRSTWVVPPRRAPLGLPASDWAALPPAWTSLLAPSTPPPSWLAPLDTLPRLGAAASTFYLSIWYRRVWPSPRPPPMTPAC